MESEQFVVENVKCQGCASNIRNGLLALPGVQDVQVEIPTGQVTVQGQGLAREQLAAQLRQLGYPEAVPR
jgi:copper chaperone